MTEKWHLSGRTYRYHATKLDETHWISHDVSSVFLSSGKRRMLNLCNTITASSEDDEISKEYLTKVPLN